MQEEKKHGGDKVGIWIWIPLLVAGVRLRHVGGGAREGVREEILAGQHHPQGHPWQGESAF